MKSLVALLVIPLIFLSNSLAAAELVLAGKEKSTYQIVLPDTLPTPALDACLLQTARLMQTAFRAHGSELSILKEKDRDSTRPAIYLGNTRFAQQQKLAIAKLQGWGYFHKVVGRDVIIVGRDQPSPDAGGGASARRPNWDRVGTAKGVADFLRQYAGVRFLFPDVVPTQSIAATDKIDLLATPAIEYLPVPQIAVPDDLDVRHIPPLEYNTAYPATGGFYDIAHNRFPLVDEVFGGHTYHRAVPVDKYATTHPEYFALIGGQRSGGKGNVPQYCISNPEVQELIYQDLIEWLDRGYHRVDIGQPDGFRPCQCEECAKLYDTGNDWSEKLWTFHRKLAERVLVARPDKQVTIMSYIQTALPPKSFRKFPANTAILLTGTNEQDIAPWRDCEVPAGFSSYIYNWCPNLGTRYTPMRTPRFVAEQAKRLVANRFQSIYRDGTGSLFGLEGPVYYTMGRMFDDTEKLEAKLLVHEYCEAAFGKSAAPMVQFYDQLYHGIELYSEFLGTRAPAWAYRNMYGQSRKYVTDPFQMLGFLYTPNLLASLETQLAQAERLADRDKVKQRLDIVRREFDYLAAVGKVVHLHQAYQVQPDLASRDRLLAAVDAFKATVAGYYDARGGAKPRTGWAYPMFPPIGHNIKHLQLAHDGYQEPYANTAFNWDTAAMRSAPLPGAKRINAALSSEPITLDSPQWQAAETAPLTGLPAGVSMTRQTTVRVMHDLERLYVRCELTPSAEQEAVTVYLSPSSDRQRAYRFTINLPAGTKQQAAAGLISDALDPRYGKFDVDWNGAWSFDSKQIADSPTKQAVMFTIPYKSIDAEVPVSGSFWRGNFTRTSRAGAQAETSLWSSFRSTKTTDDSNDFGEIVFAAKSDAKPVGKSPEMSLRKVREDLYSASFDIPAEWKKLPNALPTPLGQWLFRRDLLEQGITQQWFADSVPTADWTPIQVPSFWAENEAFQRYTGYGWYRTSFQLPAEWKGRGVRISFGAVDEQAWVYVNGKLVREHTEASEKRPYHELWESPFVAEVDAAQLSFDQPNVLAVRVHNQAANGGIWRSVLVHALPQR